MRISKVLLAAAALTTMSAPMSVQAADVRPSDARVAVTSQYVTAAPSQVRAGAKMNTSETQELAGLSLAALIAAIIAALVAAGIIIDDNKSP